MEHAEHTGTEAVGGLLHWLSGGDAQYHTLGQCLQGDFVAVALIVFLGQATFFGYLYWGRVLTRCRETAFILHSKVVIIYCGAMSYGFIALKTVWPAWRLYIIALVLHVLHVWYVVYLGHRKGAASR